MVTPRARVAMDVARQQKRNKPPYRAASVHLSALKPIHLCYGTMLWQAKMVFPSKFL